jgi:hypothetical protein
MQYVLAIVVDFDVVLSPPVGTRNTANIIYLRKSSHSILYFQVNLAHLLHG